MPCANAPTARDRGHVEPLGVEPRRLFDDRELGFTLLDRLRDLRARLADELAGCAALWDRVKKDGLFAGVGYNHTLGRNTVLAEEILRSGLTGPVATISARTREHWGGIFKAHPWLLGPSGVNSTVMIQLEPWRMLVQPSPGSRLSTVMTLRRK